MHNVHINTLCRELRQRFEDDFFIFLFYVQVQLLLVFFFLLKRKKLEIFGRRTYAVYDIIVRETFSFGKVYVKCSFHVFKTKYDDDCSLYRQYVL